MSEITDKLRAAYNAVAYETIAYPNTHPHRMAAAAILKGLIPPKTSGARILEVGCGVGGNILPMAEQLPDCQLLGIDLSPQQIDAGNAVICELGLKNIELRTQDISDFGPSEGPFDYIIAHGVYSWVPADVQKRLLEMCQANLAPNGLAYISYNTLPGWRLKVLARDMMTFQARHAQTPEQRVALGRQIMDFAAENAKFDQQYQKIIAFMRDAVAEARDSYLLHEYLEETNSQCYFSEFAGQLAEHQLSFVTELHAVPNSWLMIPDDLRQKLYAMSADPVEREQYLDFLINRAFRADLVCRREASLGAVSLLMRMNALSIAQEKSGESQGKDAGGNEVVRFGAGQFVANLNDARIVRLLRYLSDNWPATIPLVDAAGIFMGRAISVQELESLARELMPRVEALHALGVLEVWPRATTPVARRATRFPKAAQFARWQALHSPRGMATLRHRVVQAPEAVRQLITLLDGTRDHPSLLQELRSLGVKSVEEGVNGVVDENWVNGQLEVLSKAGFLLPEASTRAIN